MSTYKPYRIVAGRIGSRRKQGYGHMTVDESCPVCDDTGCVVCWSVDDVTIGTTDDCTYDNIAGFDVDVTDERVRSRDGFDIGDCEVSFNAELTVPQSVVRKTNRRAVDTLQSKATHEFDCDGFDRETFDDAVHSIESAGYDTARWVMPSSVVESLRSWYDDRFRVSQFDGAFVDDRVSWQYPIVEVSDDVEDTDALLVATDAVSNGPSPFTDRIIVVDPDGVAVIHT